MDVARGNPELARPQEKVRVGGGAEGVADDEEGDVDGGCVVEDFVGGGFDEFAVGEDDGAAVEFFLLGGRSAGVRWGSI